MKKLLFLLGGVVTLTACGTDSVFEDEIDQETVTNSNNGSQYQTNTYTGSGKYISPWNFNKRVPVGYFYESNLEDNFGIYIRITPYIGLAYFDGADDGTYNTPTGSFNLTTALYPNIYNGVSEYGNYVQANPIVLANHSGDTPPWYTHELMVFSAEEHCPLRNVNIGYNYNLQAVDLDITNNHLVQPVTTLGYALTPPPPAGTNSEEQLLSQYGKVFYYKIEFGNSPTSFNSDVYYALALEARPLIDDPSEWTNLALTDSFNGDLYYHSGGTAITNEIVVDATTVIDIYAGMKGTHTNFSTSVGTITFKTSSFHFWGNGSPWFTGVPGENIHIVFEN